MDISNYTTIKMFRSRRGVLAVGVTEDGVIDVWNYSEDDLLLQLDYAEVDTFAWALKIAKSAYGGENDK